MDVHLLHGSGPDRDSLAAYLSRAGYEIFCHESLAALPAALDASPGAVVVAHGPLLASDPGVVGDHPLLVLGSCPSLPSDPPTLDEPYFLGDIARSIAQLAAVEAAGDSEVAARPVAAVTSDSPTPPDGGLLLRGVAHALNNPLSAASGWVQLLGVEIDVDDPRRRVLNQVRAELGRLEKMIRALGMIGGRPAEVKGPLELAPVVRSKVEALASEGLPVSLVAPDALPTVVGDPTMFDLMLDLLLGSFLEERGRVRGLTIVLEAEDHLVRLCIDEEGGGLGAGADPRDLGILLRGLRHTRALAIALAQRLVVDEMGGQVTLKPGAGARVVLTLVMPAERSGGFAREAGS